MPRGCQPKIAAAIFLNFHFPILNQSGSSLPMSNPNNPAPTAPPQLPSTLPVVCDQCRAKGQAGDPAFAAIGDILAFEPVARRAHVNNWTAEHQRAFIAALAITGSPRQAARAIGRAAFGAEQLRTARNGKSFAAAWDSALEIARDREFARIQGNLSDLAAKRDAELADRPFEVRAGGSGPMFDRIREEEGEERAEYVEAIHRIRDRLTRARRMMLMSISGDEDKRKAWETLCGPVDWDKAERLEAQADEPFFDPDRPEQGMPNARDPDYQATLEHGWVPELGGPDAVTPLEARIAEIRTNDGGADASA